MKRTYSILSLTITVFILTACGILQDYKRYFPLQNIPKGIDGEWIDTNGIVSSFHNGIFETRAVDTEEKLSEGTYNYVGTKHVAIEIRSIIRGTISRADCTVSNDVMRLFCTSNAGLEFSLKRKMK
ncbi:hypothetical protein [Bartonella ancashensis]|uniref:Outer membrane lipoprotein n=1 Tax=Bartonella ancashensis TaxID=1318743 RepID=A0A0M4LKS2_9HYPH|nr:hypothetical protein [Bartonella ancashensis]ALE04127.1 Outer membrane lipoprotein precursor [Bartonella ancashensis]